jgi:hypothetical protein
MLFCNFVSKKQLPINYPARAEFDEESDPGFTKSLGGRALLRMRLDMLAGRDLQR